MRTCGERSFTVYVQDVARSSVRKQPSLALLASLGGLIMAVNLVCAQPLHVTVLASFNGTNGSHCSSSLTLGSNGSFYGTTSYGGNLSVNGGEGYGTVFRVTTNGVMTTLHLFGAITNSFGDPLDAAYPSGLALGRDGNFYGTTSLGGIAGAGTVFRVETNGVLTTVYSFGAIGYGGSWSPSVLTLGSDDNFYGTTRWGGNGYGSVFRVTTNGIFRALYSFGAITDTNGNPLDGSYPVAGLTLGSDGDFYGTTPGGGNSYGTVFRVTPNGVLSVLYSFGAITNNDGDPLDGASPVAGLTLGSDGNFYGTTAQGGSYPNRGPFGQGTQPYGSGTAFRVTTNGVLTTLCSFGGITNISGKYLDGFHPEAAPTLGSDGNLYGTTSHGGSVGAGTVFRVTPNGVLTTLYSFGAITNRQGDPLDGANPVAGLTLGNDGNFYGTTSDGGSSGYGTIFRISLARTPPQLAITPHGTDMLLSWPTNFTGFTLQYSTNLASPYWNINLSVPVIVNGLYTVTNLVSGAQQFFRLGQ